MELDKNTTKAINKINDSSLEIQQQIKRALQTLREQETADITLQHYRAAFDAVSALTTPAHGIAIQEFEIDGCPAEWLFPASPLAEQVILYFHSGTYIHGSCKADRALASWLAHFTQTKVLQIGYRLAPEHPFPAAISDGLTAYRWLTTHAFTHPVSIAFVGSAAGSGILLAVLQQLRDEGNTLPVAAACLSPWLDLSARSILEKSHVTTDIMLNASLLNYAVSNYVLPKQTMHPLVSPLYANLRGFPPLLLQVGQHEILQNDAYQLVARAQSVQVRAHCITWTGMFHGWHAFAGTLEEGQLAFEQIAAYFAKYFALAERKEP